MTKLYQRIASAIMLTTFAASVLTGCSSAPASSSQSSSDAPAVEFGLGLDSKGFYDGIKAQDYVDEDIAEKRTWKGAHFPEHREDEN